MASNDSTLFLALLFVGLAASGKKDGASSNAANGGSGASPGKRPASPAANANASGARPTAAQLSEEERRNQAALDAALKQHAADGSITVDLHEASKEQEQELIHSGHAKPEAVTPEGGGPKPNPAPVGVDANEAVVPKGTLTPPHTSTLPGGRSPEAAALQLMAFLKATRRFGGGGDRPAEVKSAQEDLGVTADGIVGPKTRAAAAAVGVTLPRAPVDAARDLRAFLLSTHRFGSATDKPAEVVSAQVDLGVTADGIVGPKTRAAAKKAGYTLPSKG